MEKCPLKWDNFMVHDVYNPSSKAHMEMLNRLVSPIALWMTWSCSDILDVHCMASMPIDTLQNLDPLSIGMSWW